MPVVVLPYVPGENAFRGLMRDAQVRRLREVVLNSVGSRGDDRRMNGVRALIEERPQFAPNFSPACGEIPHRHVGPVFALGGEGVVEQVPEPEPAKQKSKAKAKKRGRPKGSTKAKAKAKSKSKAAPKAKAKRKRRTTRKTKKD